jgi:hypothetical protein
MVEEESKKQKNTTSDQLSQETSVDDGRQLIELFLAIQSTALRAQLILEAERLLAKDRQIRLRGH